MIANWYLTNLLETGEGLFPFDDFRNVDNTFSANRALPRLFFAVVDPFMSALHAYPLCHASHFPPNLSQFLP
jgi:hypothetical protein